VPMRVQLLYHGTRKLRSLKWLFGFWRGHVHRTTIDPSARQFGFPA
jgi:hypothetical protein